MTAETGPSSGSLRLLLLVADGTNSFLQRSLSQSLVTPGWIFLLLPFLPQGEAMVPSIIYLFLKKRPEVVILVGLAVSFIQ